MKKDTHNTTVTEQTTLHTLRGVPRNRSLSLIQSYIHTFIHSFVRLSPHSTARASTESRVTTEHLRSGSLSKHMFVRFDALNTYVFFCAYFTVFLSRLFYVVMTGRFIIASASILEDYFQYWRILVSPCQVSHWILHGCRHSPNDSITHASVVIPAGWLSRFCAQIRLGLLFRSPWFLCSCVMWTLSARIRQGVRFRTP